MNWIEGKLETPLGTVGFSLTSGDHVCLRTDSRDDTLLTYRGAKYSARVHLYKREIIGWVLDDSRDSNGDVWRYGVSGAKDDTAPKTHRAAIRAALLEAWTAHVARHPMIVQVAEEKRLASIVSEKASLVEKLTAQLEEAKSQHEAAKQEYIDFTISTV